MSSAFQVVRLAPADLAAMRRLNYVFGEAFEDPASYHDAPPSDEHLAGLLAKDHVIVLAAIREDEVIGGLVAYELDKFEKARRELYIYDLAVEETSRRQGVATALIRALQAIGRERGAYVIFVQADHGDEPAMRLYESLGAREEVLHYDIPV
jgi:aminoglycoside 3-N-acetyltransferase I